MGPEGESLRWKWDRPVTQLRRAEDVLRDMGRPVDVRPPSCCEQERSSRLGAATPNPPTGMTIEALREARDPMDIRFPPDILRGTDLGVVIDAMEQFVVTWLRKEPVRVGQEALMRRLINIPKNREAMSRGDWPESIFSVRFRALLQSAIMLDDNLPVGEDWPRTDSPHMRAVAGREIVLWEDEWASRPMPAKIWLLELAVWRGPAFDVAAPTLIEDDPELVDSGTELRITEPPRAEFLPRVVKALINLARARIPFAVLKMQHSVRPVRLLSKIITEFQPECVLTCLEEDLQDSKADAGYRDKEMHCRRRLRYVADICPNPGGPVPVLPRGPRPTAPSWLRPE